MSKNTKTVEKDATQQDFIEGEPKGLATIDKATSIARGRRAVELVHGRTP